MPFIPHTEQDVQEMLAEIGVSEVSQLFDEIPPELKAKAMDTVPKGLCELELKQLMKQRAAEDGGLKCYAGAGAYEHHIPAAVWNLVSRGEFYTAYTPYQAEASQGTLQLLYEFQAMICELTAMDASNASLYDAASGVAEAIMMAVRCNRKSKSKKVLVAGSMHPRYRQAAATLVGQQGITIETLPFCAKDGHTLLDSVAAYDDEDIAALVIPQPNFFGVLEDVHDLTNWAHEHGSLVVGVVNPVAMALIEPPGYWGNNGADIVCGEGQPLGVPLSSGGPYFGFLTCKQAYVRQMPGRIVGRTVDSEGREGFALTLQAREQHIRRSKATSNICTNQGLLVTAATIHMSILGGEGLIRVAKRCHANLQTLVNQLHDDNGIEVLFHRPRFHEVVLRLSKPVEKVLQHLEQNGFLGGVDLGAFYDELPNCLLVCVTETKAADEIADFAQALKAAMAEVA